MSQKSEVGDGDVVVLEEQETLAALEAQEHKVEKEKKESMVQQIVSSETSSAVNTEEAMEKRFKGTEELPSYPFAAVFSNKVIKYALFLTIAVAIVIYTIAAISIDPDRGLPVLYIEIFFAAVFLIRLLAGVEAVKGFFTSLGETFTNLSPKVVYIIYAGLIAGAMAISAALSRDDLGRLFAFVGIFAIIFVCWLFSWNRRAISWRPVVWGFALQFVFGILILKTKPGENVFKFFGDQIGALSIYTNAGVEFVFGDLFGPPLDNLFVLNVLPIIILYSGLTSVLFHFGVLQAMTMAIGKVMIYTMGTTAPESLNAAGNIFLGQTESPLLIRPYLSKMTNSEIHAVMTGGFATIAGGVLVGFIQLGIPAEHLISASVMSAPAALAISKIVYPETMKVDDSHINKLSIGESYTNSLEAFSRGASIAIGLIASIVANLIAFLALIAFIDEVVDYFFQKIDVDDMSFQKLIGYFFYPFAFLMGIPLDDCEGAAELLGIKTVVNEFVAFLDLNGRRDEFEPRSFEILTYALCGFSNFSSIGIQLGSLGAMAPSKLPTMSKLALSAMICGNFACFMTACIASVLLGG